MRALIADRTMPPNPLAAGSRAATCDRALTEAERATLLGALSNAARAQNAFDALPASSAGQSDAVESREFGPAAAWTHPASGGMRIRTYSAEVDPSAPKRVRGVRLSNPQALQRSPFRFASIAPDPKGTVRMMAIPGQAGVEAMGNVGRMPSGSLGAVSRTAPVFELPEGFAFELPRGFVAIETLGEPIGREAPLDARLAWIAARPNDDRTVRPLAFFPDERLVLEPGERSARTVTRRLERATDAVALILKGGAFLRSVRLSVRSPDGSESRVLEIADFRMALDEPIVFREPLRVVGGSEVVVEFRYDNSGDNPQQPSNPPVKVIGGLPPRHEDTLAVLLHAPVITAAAASAAR